jgi:hypothetical protein
LSLFNTRKHNIFVMYSEIKETNTAIMGETTNANYTTNTFLRKLSLTAVTILCSLISMQAQGWDFTFGAEKTDEGQVVLQTNDWGYLALGTSESFGQDNDKDIYAVRTDVDGTVVWSGVFDEGIRENVAAAIELPNGSIVILGDIEQTPGEQPDLYLLQISKDGEYEWSSIIDTDTEERGNTIVQNGNGGFAIIGQTKNLAGDYDVLFVEVDENGIEQNRRTYQFIEDQDLDEQGAGLVKLDDGFAFVANLENPNAVSDNDIVLVRTDEAGEIIWTEVLSTFYNGIYREERVMDLIRTQNDELVISGYIADTAFVFDRLNAYAAKFDLDGQEIWSTSFGADLKEELNAIIELPDQSLVAVGLVEVTPDNGDILLCKLTPDGELEWQQQLGRTDYLEVGADLALTVDNGFIITGYNGIILSLGNDLTLLKTDAQGNTLSSLITGRVFVDEFGDPCAYDPGEELLEGWLVEAKSDDITYYATTDAAGRYEILVDTGEYELTILPINDYWEPCIDDYNGITVSEFYDTLQNLNFPIFEGIACPFMEVDVSAPFLVECSDVDYTVSYCNLGTGPAINARVEVVLDEDLTYIDNSLGIPPTVDDSLYIFLIGNVASNECDAFEIYTELACEGIASGQAALVKAKIFPDTICTPPDPDWDGASIVPNGWCDTDSVKFTLTNLGADVDLDPGEQLNYIVTQDDLVLLYGSYETLEAEAILEIGVEKDGATYRLIAEQSPGHPGSKFPTIAIEGCVDNDTENYTTGFVAAFPENDQDPNVSIDVQEIISSDESILLRGYPKGYGVDNTIPVNTDITYNLFFENIGTDTIRRVVIRDTLSPHLDITSVTPGTSSHPFEFEVYNNGVLKITFSDITLLPGSSTAESTYGFVKFRIAQKPNNPVGTVIENSAAVFFDYQTPQQTNAVLHTVGCEDLLDQVEACLDSVLVSISEAPNLEGVTIKVLPNPFLESTMIEVEGKDFRELTYSAFDMTGRMVQHRVFSGNQLVVTRDNLPAGMYIFKLTSEGQLIGNGKLLVR